VDQTFKIVFFDIDWTIYDHKNHRFSPNALPAIKHLKQAGYKVVLCTARPYHSFNSLGTNDLGIDWDGYISSAGAIAFAEGQYLRKDLVSHAKVLSFIAAVKRRHQTMELVEPLERKLVFPQTYSSRQFYKAYVEVVPPLLPYEGEEVVSFNYFAPARYDAAMKAEFPDLVYSRFFDYAVDVMPRQHEKGEACDDILRYYGFKKEESIGFGDDFQDLSLCAHVGKFVCMGNGRDEVKKAASFVTTPVWEDGIEVGLRHFGLLK
jgi:Cof subfamily protein (haloacid dehalogenase superfamily)